MSVAPPESPPPEIDDHDSTGPKGITEAALKAALRKHAGIFASAARELGCDRSNVRRRVERSVELQEFVAEIEREADDLAKGIVIDTLGERDLRGKPTKEARNMARWYRDHGLRREGVKLRLAGSDGGPLPAQAVMVTVVYVDPNQKADEDVI